VTSPQEWFAVEITVAAEATEAIEFCFNELDSLGTEIHEFRVKQDDDVTIIGYFSRPLSDTDLVRQLNSALTVYGLNRSVVRSINNKSIENTDWLSEWKKHWRPTRVGRFVIAPQWENVAEEPGTIVIRIEPNMAFGTGTHETTRLCLKAIDEHFQPGMTFLDVGTGTGILAIAAAKLKGKSHAFDVDTDAVKIARQNAEENGVANEIEFSESSIHDRTSAFDFVCANLTIDVILPMLSLLIEKARKVLVLSGILVEQEDQIVAELKRMHVAPFTVERDGEWIAVIIKL